MKIMEKDLCFKETNPHKLKFMETNYPRSVVVNLTKGTEGMFYHPSGNFVDYASLSTNKKAEMTKWGLDQALLRVAEVYYVVDETGTGELQERQFTSEELAETYALETQQKVFTKTTYVTTDTYEGEVRLQDTLIGYLAELSVHLHYIKKHTKSHGVVLPMIAENFAILFDTSKLNWVRLGNMGEYLLLKMAKKEEHLKTMDKHYARRSQELRKLNIDTRMRDTNFFVERVSEDIYVVVGCGQLGYSRGNAYNIINNKTESYKTMLNVALSLKALKSADVLKAQMLR